MSYYTVYKTTNKINGKYYIGKRIIENLNNDRYLGSGTHFKNAVNKYGEENFEKEILFFLDNYKDMNDKEREIIAEHDAVADPNSYNKTPGGDGGSPKGLIWITNGKKSKRIPENNEIPDGWRKGSHIKSCLGLISITNGKESKKIPKDTEIPEGWWKGQHFKSNIGTMWITNGKESKMISENDEIPNGWYKGTHYKHNIGTMWITDGKESKMIPEGDPLPDGWRKGMTKR